MNHYTALSPWAASCNNSLLLHNSHSTILIIIIGRSYSTQRWHCYHTVVCLSV